MGEFWKYHVRLPPLKRQRPRIYISQQLTERNLPGDIGQTGSRLGDVTFISLSLPDNTETDLLSIQHNSLQC